MYEKLLETNFDRKNSLYFLYRNLRKNKSYNISIAFYVNLTFTTFLMLFLSYNKLAWDIRRRSIKSTKNTLYSTYKRDY